MSKTETKKIEDEVIKRAQRGSKKDFEKIYALFSPKIYRFVFYKVRSKSDADDVASESWMNIVKNLKGYSFESSFSTWIYSIVKNIIAQYYRNLYAKPSETFEDWMEGDKSLLDSNFEFDHDVEQVLSEEDKSMFKDEEKEKDINIKEGKVREFLSKLKPLQSKLIELRFLKGYKIKEVAEELKLSISNVKIIQLRAIKKIQDIAAGVEKKKKPKENKSQNSSKIKDIKKKKNAK
ncbi:MAG: sigma-70 family RNA polymerase sigma factor [bacterium]